jgi:hypothetical protein
VACNSAIGERRRYCYSTSVSLKDGIAQFRRANGFEQDRAAAVNGGGRTADVLHSDATLAQALEFFRFYFDSARGYHAIQTVE